ncbi:hypothetical protein [Caldinitratiruptor microaerophilus]|uniref:Uncharacterized protein n=1 Tax=Caldinitratiruptor microaerophilus TaxID=671077 RepID=A0AA35G5N4_9FIRM|nr:hypothetical protein [Caldinitratiruptor microaerophilus]BDG59776.1 hypothetical protein caldi_08660 [Caldinitratiruptor microaerophilus]
MPAQAVSSPPGGDFISAVRRALAAVRSAQDLAQTLFAYGHDHVEWMRMARGTLSQAQRFLVIAVQRAGPSSPACTELGKAGQALGLLDATPPDARLHVAMHHLHQAETALLSCLRTLYTARVSSGPQPE